MDVTKRQGEEYGNPGCYTRKKMAGEEWLASLSFMAATIKHPGGDHCEKDGDG